MARGKRRREAALVAVKRPHRRGDAGRGGEGPAWAGVDAAAGNVVCGMCFDLFAVPSVLYVAERKVCVRGGRWLVDHTVTLDHRVNPVSSL